MKKVFFLFVLIGFYSFSQDCIILKKDGTKFIIKNNSFHVDAEEKSISYKLLAKEAELRLNYKDFDYAEIGINKFKIYRLDNSKEGQVFFVLAESKNRTLIGISTQNGDSETSTIKSYTFHIIDDENNIIESQQFNNLKNSKNSFLRSQIYYKIKFYFQECERLMIRLSSFDKNSDEFDNTAILGFFNSPVCIKCSE